MTNFTSNHAIIAIEEIAGRTVITVEKRGGRAAHKTTASELQADVERIAETLREAGYTVEIEGEAVSVE